MNESKIFYDKTITEYYVKRRFCSHLQMSNQAVGAATESMWIDLKFLTSGISLNFNLVIWDYINLFEVLWIPMQFKCLLSYWMERFSFLCWWKIPSYNFLTVWAAVYNEYMVNLGWPKTWGSGLIQKESHLSGSSCDLHDFATVGWQEIHQRFFPLETYNLLDYVWWIS
jgi:hypothetical protein